MGDDSQELAFSDKYDKAHSEAYYKKHKQGFWRNFSNSREIKTARRALKIAGNPESILDLPCGAGRFWGLLATGNARKLIAADYSSAMLEVASKSQPEIFSSKFTLLQTSAFDIKLPDSSVENIFCMRLIHHMAARSDRLRLLKEFHRVTQKTVCISLWVDGNIQSWRRQKLESKRRKRAYQNRLVIPAATIEQEFEDSGFKIRKHVDMAPLISMWRVYILEKVPEKVQASEGNAKKANKAEGPLASQ
ncbi:MAG: methyltransferase domain-containing protein [Pseudomonadales bacterium]|jgi:SAM-dependent methyltransferase